MLVFNHKTRFHWVYYSHESSGEQRYSQGGKSGIKTCSLESNPNWKAVMLGRSASMVVPQKHRHRRTGLAGRR